MDGIAPDSTTESFVALRLDIGNWRWAGVPFFIRAGKKLAATETELRIVFKQPPAVDFGFGYDDSPDRPRDQLVIRLDPNTGVRLRLDARRADAPQARSITLSMNFAAEGGEAPTPYEVLLHAAMVGEMSKFKRQDVVEENWRIMQPLLDPPPPVLPYQPGSWGPEEADHLVADYGGWHGPWIV